MAGPADRFSPSRRAFLRKSGLGLGIGFSLGVLLPGCSREEPDVGGKLSGFHPSVWLTITPENQVRVTLAESEMGQGVMTAIPMLIAEELDADWDQLVVEQAPVSPRFGHQATGGSSSVRKAWRPLREAGATARQILLEAAAAAWSVAPDSCETESGRVIHRSSERFFNYGELALLAADRPLPKQVRLKDPSQYRLIGNSPKRKGLEQKVDGQAQYGIDQKLPGLLTALVARPPTLGAQLVSFDAAEAGKLRGVKKIFAISTGVAVVASGFWEAQRALKALKVQWREDRDQAPDSKKISALLAANMQAEAEVKDQRGAALAQFDNNPAVVEALYELPLQAHAAFEPMNCTAWFHDDLCEIWAPTQVPTDARDAAMEKALSTPEKLWHKIALRLTGQRSDPVLLHTTLLGGGFGRRLQTDYVEDAVEIAQRLEHPVKVIWTREDDFREDYFRPATLQRMRALLDKDGYPKAWHHRVVNMDGGTGGAGQLAYAIPDVVVDRVKVRVPGLRTGYWRSVAHSYTAFAKESFIDELAHRASADPYLFRKRLLTHSPRQMGVLDAVAQAANWGDTQASARYLGIAVHEAFATHVAQVAEIRIDDKGAACLTKIFCAVDCGQVIHPDTVLAQIEGSIIFALNTLVKSQISLHRGAVEQVNFHQFELLRINEIPDMQIQLSESMESPGGVGEPAVPPLAPAVANAFFAATGQRPRSLPLAPGLLQTGRTGF